MEERMNAAKALRGYGLDDLKGNSLLKTLKAVTGGASWRACLLLLADLIDPTCTVEDVFDTGSEMEYHLSCGDVFGWNEVDAIAYCPHCGARIVDGR